MNAGDPEKGFIFFYPKKHQSSRDTLFVLICAIANFEMFYFVITHSFTWKRLMNIGFLYNIG